MKTKELLKTSVVGAVIVLTISFVITTGKLTAAEGTGSESTLAQDIAKTVAAQPVDAVQLRSLLEPLGWGVTLEADGSITLVPGVCRPTATAAKQAQMTQQVMSLMEKKGYKCLECHQVDSGLRGPSFKEVAARRRCHKWAVDLLTYKISQESPGEYEQSHHMQRVSEEDAPIIVDWVLSN